MDRYMTKWLTIVEISWWVYGCACYQFIISQTETYLSLSRFVTLDLDSQHFSFTNLREGNGVLLQGNSSSETPSLLDSGPPLLLLFNMRVQEPC